jgi:hypothetical protein
MIILPRVCTLEGDEGVVLPVGQRCRLVRLLLPRSQVERVLAVFEPGIDGAIIGRRERRVSVGVLLPHCRGESILETTKARISVVVMLPQSGVMADDKVTVINSSEWETTFWAWLSCEPV